MGCNSLLSTFMADQKKQNKLVTSDGDQLLQRITRLRNKFTVAAFIHESGIEWAKEAIDPNSEKKYWTHDAYLECYESGTNN